MLRRFMRTVLGLALATMFAGQTAFGSDLCGRSAHSIAVSKHDAPHAAAPCHETGGTAAVHHGEDVVTSTPDDTGHHPCECAATPMTCLAAQPVLASTSVMFWTWRTPAPVAFVSADHVPDGPPPKT